MKRDCERETAERHKRRLVERCQLVSGDRGIVAGGIDHAVVVAQLLDVGGPLVCAVHVAAAAHGCVQCVVPSETAGKKKVEKEGEKSKQTNVEEKASKQLTGFALVLLVVWMCNMTVLIAVKTTRFCSIKHASSLRMRVIVMWVRVC